MNQKKPLELKNYSRWNKNSLNSGLDTVEKKIKKKKTVEEIWGDSRE